MASCFLECARFAVRALSAVTIAGGAAVGLGSPALHAAECDPQELYMLTDSDLGALEGLGGAVAMSGDIAIIGAPEEKNDLGHPDAGAAFLFDVGTRQQLFKLTASDASIGDEFGHSVGIDGGVAIVGAPGAFASAYLFDVVTGQQLFKLTTDAEAWFGQSVAISGDIAIVGASGDDDAGSESGSAFLFDVASGQQLFQLIASDGAPNDHFGYAVAISGDIAIIATINIEDGPQSWSAYLFDVSTGRQLFKLTSDSAEDDFFGYSIAISGNTAIVGAPLDNAAGFRAGSAYVYNATTGQQLFKLTASDAEPEEFFGASVAISGSIALIGAQGDDDAGEFSGSVYGFDIITGQELFKFIASDADDDEWFGSPAAMSGDNAIVGRCFAQECSYYLFDLNCSALNSADVDEDGEVNIDDVLAVLNAWGPCTSPPAECSADVDGSGDIGLDDLLLIFSNWTG